MFIKGIGIVKKETAMSILTSEGRKMFFSGDITTEELGEMYKLEQVKKLSKIGSMHDTFSANYRWIPENLKEELSPEDLAALTDAFYNAYSSGKNEK